MWVDTWIIVVGAVIGLWCGLHSVAAYRQQARQQAALQRDRLEQHWQSRVNRAAERAAQGTGSTRPARQP